MEGVLHLDVDPAELPMSVEDGQIWVHLPFAVDVKRLSAYLAEADFCLAHRPDDFAQAGVPFPDSQGWGPDCDPGSYYPWWVFPDPTRPGYSVFAFTPQPEDVVQRRVDHHTEAWPDLGEESQALVRTWVPILAGFALPPAEAEDAAGDLPDR